jgi:hypothetical protein
VDTVIRHCERIFSATKHSPPQGADCLSGTHRNDEQLEKEKTMYKNITKIALKGIALAMGVAVIVLGTLKTLDVNTGVSMLGMGLTALALANFQE